MGHMQELVKKRERLTASIRMLLENRGISGSTDWWTDPAAQAELERLAESEGNCAAGSGTLGITQEEDGEALVFAAFRESTQKFRELVQEELNRAAAGSVKSVQLVFFVEDMRSRVRLEAAFTGKVLQDMKSRAKKAAGTGGRLSLFYTCILVRSYVRQDVRLKGLKRYEMIQEPPMDRSLNLETAPDPAPAVQTLVFTADLYQLAELYNTVGDQLFQNNVRFGINETLGVDQSIRQTLEREPGMFWYKNNGITLLILERQAFLRCASELRLGRLDPEQAPAFSVVNGAQTITTAARYFFKLEYDIECCQDPGEKAKLEEKLKAAKEEAKVLVRVTQIGAGPGEEDTIREKANDISVALNRQKPIRIEDIAFTSPAVHKLSEYLRAREGLPRLVRRGEETGGGKELTLIEFVRARMACAGFPGAARSKSANELLRFKPGEDNQYTFSYPGLFADDWQEAEGEEEEDAIFNRDYRAVWFAHQTARDYDKHVKALKPEDPDVLAVINNGKWYFTALSVQMVNKCRMARGKDGGLRPDFTQFDSSGSGLEEDFPETVLAFAEMAVSAIRKNNIREINSNLFKNENLYEKLIEILKLSEKKNNEGRQPSGQIQPLASELAREIRTAPVSDYVRLAGNIFPVSSDAQAVAHIAEYVLSTYNVPDDVLNSACGTWLSYDSSAVSSGSGYFRGAPRRIQAGSRFCWVGTSSNTAAKRRQIRSLCKLAPVKPGEVEWYKNGTIQFPV